MMSDLARPYLVAFVARCGSQAAAARALRCSRQFIGQILSGSCAVPASMYKTLGIKSAIVLR